MAKNAANRLQASQNLNSYVLKEIRRVLSLQEISQNVLEEFARYVIANHNKKEPTLTTAAIKKAVYDHFGVGEKRTVANLRKSSRFLMETEGMEIPALSSSEGWKALYREFIGYLPSEEYQAGYGCINGVNIFQYFKPWRVFGLDPEKATQQDKKDAYYRLSKIYHPDNKETGDGRIFDLINNMYASITAEA